MDQDSYSDAEIKKFLKLKKVAVIGMSRNKSKAAHFVPKYLSENGFDIIPVNPNSDEILNKKCYKEINDIEGPLYKKIVDVLGRETEFRKNEILFYIYDDGSIDKKFFK